MSRALLNDTGVVDFIKENFIAVSGAVEHLQPGRYGSAVSKSSRWFEPAAKRAIEKFGPPGFFKQFGSYQGMYVLGPDATPYEYKIGLPYDPQEFIGVLKTALARARAAQVRGRFSPQVVTIAGSDLPPGPPAGTSVIQIYSRILPLPENATLSERSLGRDVMWIFPEEIDEILAGAEHTGCTRNMPATLVARMVRFQLLNHVGNIMRQFSENDCRKADFRLTCSQTQGNLVTFTFKGSYDSLSAGEQDKTGPFSMTGTIEGRILLDRGRRRIVQFRAFGEGLSQGGNDSLDSRRKYPVLFAMTEATQPAALSIKPFWAAVPTWEKVYRSPEIRLKGL